MTKATTLTEKSKKQRDNIKVGETKATLLVWLNRLTSAQPSRHNSRVIKTTHI